MTTETTKSIFWQGVRDGAPFILVIIPFSTLFGVVATEAGLNVFETLTFSVLVIAGAAQFTAVELLRNDVPTAIVLISALAVNLRMAMYSASLVPYLGSAPLWQRAFVAYLMFDQTYIGSVARYETQPDMTVRDRVAYFLGLATPITPVWMIMTLVGILAGAAIPQAWALDFAIPIMFLAMVAPMLKSLAHVAAAAVSIVVALLLIGLPSGTGLLIAAVAAMVTGAAIETMMERRRK